MPAYKDSKTGTQFVKFYCKDWTRENKQIKKRGFATKREELDYERNYKIRRENNLDMVFGEFWNDYSLPMYIKWHNEYYCNLKGYFERSEKIVFKFDYQT